MSIHLPTTALTIALLLGGCVTKGGDSTVINSPGANSKGGDAKGPVTEVNPDINANVSTGAGSSNSNSTEETTEPEAPPSTPE